MTDAIVTQVGVEEFASTIPPELWTTQAVVEEWAMVVTLISVSARMDGLADMSAPGATFRAASPAFMSGQAEMLADGVAFAIGAAAMDGLAQFIGLTVVTASGAAQMDGLADVLVDVIAMAVGEARMDGRAQGEFNSADLVKGTANMDGRGSMVAGSVEGVGLAEMDGEASVFFMSPHYFNAFLSDGIVGGQSTSVRMTYNVTTSQAFVAGEIMKPKVRYHLVLTNPVTWTDAVSFRMKFIKLVKDVTIRIAPSLEPHTQFHYGVTTPINVEPTLDPEWHAVLSLVQGLLIGQTAGDKVTLRRTLLQALKVSGATSLSGRYQKVLAQLIKFIEVENLKLSHPVTLDEDIDLSSVLTGGYGLKLLQKLLVGVAASSTGTYHFTLNSQVKLRDFIDRLVMGLLEDLFTVHDAPDRQYIAKNLLTQLLAIHPALTTALVLKIEGNIELSPEQVVHMLYTGDPLLDGVVINALFISPSGTTTTWAVNTRTQAVTEYTNYDFHSFTQMGNRYVAAGREGLYELDGDTDEGALIIGRMMSGYLQLNEKKLFGLKGVYVAIRGGGRFYLRLVAGDGREYTYELRAQPNLMTTKVKVGKGISTTYMAYELVTEGQDFDLDSIEFIPMTRGRRV